MKLNARDQLVLVVVLIVAVWALGILYFIKPSIEGAKSAQNTLDEKNTELLSKQKLIEDDKNLDQDVQAAYDKATETKSIFFPRVIQNVAATTVQSKFYVDDDDEQDIKNTNLAVSTITKGQLQKYLNNSRVVTTTLDDIASRVGQDGNVAVVTTQNIDVTCYTFSLNFSATKEKLIQFMENLLPTESDQKQKSIVITALAIPNVAENEDDTEWVGSMSLELYMVPELPEPAEVDDRINKSGSSDAGAETEE